MHTVCTYVQNTVGDVISQFNFLSGKGTLLWCNERVWPRLHEFVWVFVNVIVQTYRQQGRNCDGLVHHCTGVGHMHVCGWPWVGVHCPYCVYTEASNVHLSTLAHQLVDVSEEARRGRLAASCSKALIAWAIFQFQCIQNTSRSSSLQCWTSQGPLCIVTISCTSPSHSSTHHRYLWHASCIKWPL